MAPVSEKEEEEGKKIARRFFFMRIRFFIFFNVSRNNIIIHMYIEVTRVRYAAAGRTCG